jgi:hypothetical protein
MNQELIGTSLFANDRWELNDSKINRDKIERATINAWHELINFGETYEYPSIMACCYHLISLFVEDYPSGYDAYDIGIVALKIAFIQLSQGKVEDPTWEDLGAFPSKKLFEIELKMLSYPYHRCFALMETELLDPDDLYALTVNLMEEQIGDRMERSYLARLRRNIFDYYQDIQSHMFFEQTFEPYIRIGGPNSFNQSKLQARSGSRQQTEKLRSQQYPPYLDRNNIPNI